MLKNTSGSKVTCYNKQDTQKCIMYACRTKTLCPDWPTPVYRRTQVLKLMLWLLCNHDNGVTMNGSLSYDDEDSLLHF